MKTLAAKLAMAACVAFIVILILLHFLKPEFDPSWRMISEYAIGQHGWLMHLAFLLFAAACVGVFVALRSQISTRGGKIGLGFLIATAVGFTIAGIFASDPITISQDQATTSGQLHGLGFLGILAMPIAATLIMRSLKYSAAWRRIRRLPNIITVAMWASLTLFFGVMMATFKGEFNPDVIIGWPGRILILSYTLWLLVISRQHLLVQKKR